MNGSGRTPEAEARLLETVAGKGEAGYAECECYAFSVTSQHSFSEESACTAGEVNEESSALSVRK